MFAALASLLLAAPPNVPPAVHPQGPFRTRPTAAPALVPLPKDSHPLLSNPQVSVDGVKAYVARVDAPPGTLRTGIHISIVPIGVDPNAKEGPRAAAPAAPTAIDLAAPVLGDDVQLLLSPNERTLATLAAGELWVQNLDGKDGPRRLYPPQSGDAPIGTRLSRAVYARDSTWILIQSPLGWGRVAVADGSLATLALPHIDLTTGSLALSPDDTHALIVRSQAGEGYQNGGNVLALNLETGFAQILDKEHLYTEVLFLPDSTPLAVDADGALWAISAKQRLPYFTPPLKSGERLGSYAVDLGLSTLAWTVVRGTGPTAKAELWSATAPLPQKTKHERVGP